MSNPVSRPNALTLRFSEEESIMLLCCAEDSGLCLADTVRQLIRTRYEALPAGAKRLPKDLEARRAALK